MQPTDNYKYQKLSDDTVSSTASNPHEEEKEWLFSWGCTEKHHLWIRNKRIYVEKTKSQGFCSRARIYGEGKVADCKTIEVIEQANSNFHLALIIWGAIGIFGLHQLYCNNKKMASVFGFLCSSVIGCITAATQINNDT